MYRPWFRVVLVILFFIISLSGTLASSATNAWNTRDPFVHSVFIENLGQYSSAIVPEKRLTVLYGARREGLEYFFTPNSILIRNLKDRAVYQHEEEEEHAEKEESLKGEQDAYNFHELKFSGSNPGVQIIPSEETDMRYHFCPANKKTLMARGFRKITYKNLYTGIDMEIFFPDDKQGFKYNFIVHPGANASLIHWSYPYEKKIYLDASGNLIEESAFGNFTDHAPQIWTEGTHQVIAGAYSRSNKFWGITTGKHPHNETLIIDPWTTTPTLTGGKAFDVDHDNAGNCYVYGGLAPFQIIKYNNLGNPVWSFTTANFTGYPTHPAYGDFAVDRTSGSVYIVEGGNVNGAEMIKLNAAGIQTAFFTGNPSMTEMWRISFSGCTHQLVMGGGGISHPSTTAAYIDTTLNTFTPVSVIPSPSGFHDIWGICADNNSNCYIVSSKANQPPWGYDDLLYKLPVPSLSPATWQTNTGYNFVEGFANAFHPRCNGYNGITISGSTVYTYDSHVLKKWNTVNGTQADSVIVNGPSTQNGRHYAGITADDCGHIFIGLNTTIRQYDANLNFIASMNAQDTVYDLSLGTGGILYACGHNFVSSDYTGVNCSQLTAVNRTTCDSAIITVSGGTPPYMITWNTNPVQTGPVITDVPAGIYIATITDQGCTQLELTDTVVIHSISAPFHLRDTSACPPLCLSVHPDTLNSTATCHWEWGDGGISNAVNASHCYSVPGTYSVTLTETLNGCTAVFINPAHITIYQNPHAAFNYDIQSGSETNREVCFINTSSQGSLQSSWWFGDTQNNTSHHTDTCFTYSEALSGSNYCVKLDVRNASGCKDSVVHCISLEPDFALYVPDAFTPNGDGLNDVFLPLGEGIDPGNYSLLIFDRWGNLIWQANRWGTGWDGRANGGHDIAQQDTYVWKIHCSDVRKQNHDLIGQVSLIK